MESWSGLLAGKAPASPGYVWPMSLPASHISPALAPQALSPWFWPGSMPPLLQPAVAAMPKQTTITEADVGKVAYEMTYAPNPSAALGGPAVVQATRETTITAADVGKWAFEMPELPLSLAPHTPSAKNSTTSYTMTDARAGDCAGTTSTAGMKPRATATKILKDKATQKYLVFDKHTQTDSKHPNKKF